MDLREALLIGHILGVVAMGFGSGAGLIAMLTAGSSPDLPTIHRVARIGYNGGRVTAFSAVVVFIFGTWLVIEGDIYDFSQAWISAAYALWFVAMGLGGGVMARHEGKLATDAEAAIGRGESSNAAVLAAYNSSTTKLVGSVLLLMYPVFMYLMVSKPGL